MISFHTILSRPVSSRVVFFARASIYVLFIIVGVYAASLLLFPSRTFTFDFRTPSSIKNTLIEPRGSHDNLVFDAALTAGEFTRALVTIDLAKNSPNTSDGTLTLRRSYRAFLSPYSAQQLSIPEEEKTIIDNTPYLVRDNQLFPFVSKKAYDRYDVPESKRSSAAIALLPRANTPVGFIDGTIVTNGASAFVVSEEKIYPFDDVTTFEALGYNWSDAIAASGEEVGMYEKTKLFTARSPHPVGTTFSATDTRRLFLLRNGALHDITGKNIPHAAPISVQEESREKFVICTLSAVRLSLSKRYVCTLPLESLGALVGNDFQFALSADRDIAIQKITVVFTQSLTFSTGHAALADIKKRILLHYRGEG